MTNTLPESGSLSSPPPASNRAAFVIMGLGLLTGLLAGLTVFVGVPDWLTGTSASAGPVSTPAPAPVVGAPAPDFSLVDLNDNEVRLADLRGQVVLVNFWATWCGPCRLEMPAIEAEYQVRQSQGFSVLGVNIDFADQLPQVKEFVQSLGLSFTVLLDPDNAVHDLYRVRGYPTSYFIDREGYVARQHVGYMTAGQLAQYLEQLGLGG